MQFIWYENTIAFAVDINAAKSFEEFFEHEKHHGLSKAKMKEIHNACKAMVKQAEKDKLGNDKQE